MARKNFILKFLFEKPLTEHSVRGFSPASRSSGDSFLNLVSSLQMAAEDNRASALLFIVHNFSAGWAQVEEIISLVKKCRDRGKKTCIYLEQADNISFYLATAFERIYMPPAGTLELIGLRIEKLYLRNLLEYVGINPELISIGKYKSAGEALMREGMSEPDREALSSILEDMNARFIKRISTGRGLETEEVKSLIDKGPWPTAPAAENGLIDRVCYEDELEDLLKAEWGGVPVDAGKRLKTGLFRRIIHSRRPRVALICASGKITDGSSRQNLLGHPVSGSRTLCKQFREVRKKKRVRAVVLRIDSPGGSASASDLIWREISLTSRIKPVICSMGNLAASGGYYIAAAASHIYASPSTLTGSIGVIGGKFDLSGLLEKLLIRTDSLQTNALAGYASATHPMSAGEETKIRSLLKNFYEGLFLKKVSMKLNKPVRDILPLAEGRVWTGGQALAAELVDSCGGLAEALDMAGAKAGIRKGKFKLMIVSSRFKLKDLLPSRKRGESARILSILPSGLRVR